MQTCQCINTQLLPGAAAMGPDSLSSLTSRSPLVDSNLYSSLSRHRQAMVCRNRKSALPFERNTVVVFYKLGMNEGQERKVWISR